MIILLALVSTFLIAFTLGFFIAIYLQIKEEKMFLRKYEMEDEERLFNELNEANDERKCI